MMAGKADLFLNQGREVRLSAVLAGTEAVIEVCVRF